MIHASSRYVGGLVVPQSGDTVAVRRMFPSPYTSHGHYTWRSTDRLDQVAARMLGDCKLWWMILDANPLVQNPDDIRPGQQIRIPARA